MVWPNQAQVMMGVRTVLYLGSGILVARGTISKEDAANATNLTISAVGALITAGTFIWGMFAASDTNAIKRTAELPEVKQIIVEPLAPPTTAAGAVAADTKVDNVTKA